MTGHNISEDQIAARKEGTIGGRRVEHLIVEQPGLSFKSVVCVEQEDGTMGRPVSADDGTLNLLKPSMLLDEHRVQKS